MNVLVQVYPVRPRCTFLNTAKAHVRPHVTSSSANTAPHAHTHTRLWINPVAERRRKGGAPPAQGHSNPECPWRNPLLGRIPRSLLILRSSRCLVSDAKREEEDARMKRWRMWT